VLVSDHHPRKQDNKIKKFILCSSLLLSTCLAQAIELHAPAVALSNVSVDITVSDAQPLQLVELRFGDSAYSEMSDAQGTATFSVMAESRGTTLLVAIDAAGERASHELRVLPGWV